MKYKYLKNDYEIEVSKNKFLYFLYNNILGRLLLRIIYQPFISKMVGFFLNSRFSKFLIKKYIRNNNIDMSRFDNIEYKSFNSFFTRKIRCIEKNKNKNSFIANCDSKVSIYNIDENLILNIKNSKYNIKELIKDIGIAKKYIGGICVVYRLEPSDYHRYIFVDSGKVIFNKKIKGKLHTVNPIVYDHYQVFTENTREVSLLSCDTFGDIVQIEVGALCVGKIRNNNKSKYKRYDEKGYFEFGGSTIIHLIEKDKVSFNEKIINNTKNDIETIVSIGEIIGKKI